MRVNCYVDLNVLTNLPVGELKAARDELARMRADKDKALADLSQLRKDLTTARSQVRMRTHLPLAICCLVGPL